MARNFPPAAVTATELQNCTLVRVEGEIDERFDGRAYAGRRGVVVFDLGGCSRITSHGVLRWINAPKRPRGRPFELKKEIDETFTAFWLGGFLDQRAHFKRLADGVESLCVLEVSDLEGASEEGTLGLSRFLSLLGDRVMLARVPAA